MTSSKPAAAAAPPSAALERRFEALVFHWDGPAAADGRAEAIRLRGLIEDACAIGLEIALVSAAHVAEMDGQLGARPAGPGSLWLLLEGGSEAHRVDREGIHLEHGERGLTGEADSVGWIHEELWRRGIAPGQVLVADDVPRTGADPLAALLERQIESRRRGELPIVDADASWTLPIEGVDPLRERAQESLLTIADGRLGTRGSVVIDHPSGDPGVLVSGVYIGKDADTRLLPAPRWNTIAAEAGAPGPVRRVLDLHAGLLHQYLGPPDAQLQALLFSSLARPGTAVLRAYDRGRRLRSAPGLLAPAGADPQQGTVDGCPWMRVTGPPGSIVAAVKDEIRDETAVRVLDRIASYDGTPAGVADERAAVGRLRQASGLGFEALLAEHRRAWASCWEDADVRIDGDQELQLAARFAVFHLLATVAARHEAAVGARGLSGVAYRGHVFWDSDVYVLPFLAATRPGAARAMLEYRVRRLPAALRAARALGRAGARLPWESAASGADVTPAQAPGSSGEMAPVLTGLLEEHIVADVAWAAVCYLDWTGGSGVCRRAGTRAAGTDRPLVGVTD